MPDSSFVYEKGDPIQVGSHGDHSYVYHSGDPVTDSGESSFVYESGTGIGGGVTLRLFSDGGDFHEELSFPEVQNGSVEGIAIHVGYQGNGGTFDFIRKNDGTIIDDMEDMDLSEYSGDVGAFNIVKSPVKNGTYAVHSSPGNHKEIYSKSGLNSYPTAGEPFRFWIYAHGGTNRALQVEWAYESGNDSWIGGFDDNGVFILQAPDGTRVEGGSYPQDGRWYEFEVVW